MIKKIEWTEDEQNQIIDYYKNQKTTREIGKIFGCSKTTITRFLKEQNIKVISRRVLNKKPLRKPKVVEDKINKIYGKLKVIKEGPRLKEKNCKAGRIRYWCECSCGFLCVLVDKRRLKPGGTKSCGCLQKQTKSSLSVSDEIKLNEEDIIKDYLAGISVHNLADNFGCSVSPIRSIINKNLGTKSIDELRIFNDEEAMAIKKAFEADPKMTYVKLAENYKCKESAIRSAIYRAGGEGRGSGFLSTINYKLDKEFCEQIWKDYSTSKDISAETVGKRYGVTEGIVLKAIRESGNKPRTPWESQIVLSSKEELEIIEKYQSGKSAKDLGVEYKVALGTILNYLRKNTIEIRERGVGGESIQMILDEQGRYKIKKETNYYVYSLSGLPEYLKPGIKYFDEDRAKHSNDYYEKLLLLDSYSTREEAYFIEQAVLRETLNYFDCPIELIPTNDNEGMIGWTEVRKMKFEELEKIIDFYKEEMESLGKWEFAASYVPMTSAQRQECINRSN